jgi:cell division protein FtsW (lipid II flippase)
MSSVYSINKGINRPIEFKGIKAQYIWYLGAGLVFLLILFAVLYIAGLNAFICLALVAALTTLLFMVVNRMSSRYGAHGLMKRLARNRIPSVIKLYSRKTFTRTWKKN